MGSITATGSVRTTFCMYIKKYQHKNIRMSTIKGDVRTVFIASKMVIFFLLLGGKQEVASILLR